MVSFVGFTPSFAAFADRVGFACGEADMLLVAVVDAFGEAMADGDAVADGVAVADGEGATVSSVFLEQLESAMTAASAQKAARERNLWGLIEWFMAILTRKVDSRLCSIFRWVRAVELMVNE